MTKNLKEIEPLSQFDPRWKNKTFGVIGSEDTIGEKGCMLIDLTMYFNYYSDEMWTPPQVDLVVKSAGLYRNGCELIHGTYAPLLRFNVQKRWVKKPADIDWIEENIKIAPLILRVKPFHKHRRLHFVFGTDLVRNIKTNEVEDIVMNDPVDGKKGMLLAKYGVPRGWDLARAIYSATQYIPFEA